MLSSKTYVDLASAIPKDYFSSKLWVDYENGFGNPEGGKTSKIYVKLKISQLASEFWLGLRQIANITLTGQWELRVDLEDFNGNFFTAVYKNFRVHSTGHFQLEVSQFDSSASTLSDSLTYNNGQAFSTLDSDHDKYSGNCAVMNKGGWWYDKCSHVNLNGYNYNKHGYQASGVNWAAKNYKKVEMKIREV